MAAKPFKNVSKQKSYFFHIATAQHRLQQLLNLMIICFKLVHRPNPHQYVYQQSWHRLIHAFKIFTTLRLEDLLLKTACFSSKNIKRRNLCSPCYSGSFFSCVLSSNDDFHNHKSSLKKLYSIVYTLSVSRSWCFNTV